MNRLVWTAAFLGTIAMGAACTSSDGGDAGGSGGGAAATGGNGTGGSAGSSVGGTGGVADGGTGGTAGANTGGGGAGGTGGTAGSNTGGSAGSGTGGTAGSNTGGSAGSGTGGTAGANTGGSAGSGTGGSAGTPDVCGQFSGVPECDTCAATNCVTECVNCLNDAECNALLTCALACTDTTCSNDCVTQHPDGMTLLDAWIGGSGCVAAACATECGGSNPGAIEPLCSAPEVAPSAGACVTIDATIQCNPVTNEGCDTAAGQACDVNGSGFQCYDPPNDLPLCSTCGTGGSDWCLPTLTCAPGSSTGNCARFCCDDGDCAGGVCDTSLGLGGGVGVCAVAP